MRLGRLALCLVLCLALASPQIAASAEFALTPTETVVRLDPSTVAAGDPAKAIASVTPVPDAGRVSFTFWTASTGGEVLESDTIAVNALGQATWGGLEFGIGTIWAEATYKGSAYYAPSTSPRAPLTVIGKAPTVTFSTYSEMWVGDRPTLNWRIAPSEAADGLLEVLVDGELLMTDGLDRFEDTGSIRLETVLGRGQHEIRLRIRPTVWKYTTGLSAPWTLRVVDPPGSSSRAEFLASPTRTRDVWLTPPPSLNGVAVEEVRLSNSAPGGEGWLTDGATLGWAAVLPWTLADGEDGTRTVWMQLKLADGTWTSPASDTTFLDRTAPTGSVSLSGGATIVGSPWEATLYEQELTGLVTDNSLGQGGAITHAAMSNDGVKWAIVPFTGDPANHVFPWQVAWRTYGFDGQPGAKTVYMKWRDHAGNWSSPATWQFQLLHGETPAHMFVNGTRGHRDEGGGYISDPDVTLTFSLTTVPPGGIDYVVIKNPKGTKTKKVAWEPNLSVPWSLVDTAYGYTTTDGMKEIVATVYPNQYGLYKGEAGLIVFLDRVVPTSSAPLPAFAPNTMIAAPSGSTALAAAGETEIAAEVAWTGDDRNGLLGYDLQQSIDASAWSNVPLVDDLVAKTVRVLSLGPKYRYRSRSTDIAGNISSWRSGPSFAARMSDETASALRYRGTWRTTRRSDALGGSLRTAKGKGASVTYTFTGRAIAWVAPRSADGESANVYINGKLVKVVHLSLTSGYSPRLVVFSMSWKKVATRTIRIVKRYASGEISVDAMLVLR